MFTQFRTHYPHGSLITELSTIDHGQYIVRCLVQVEGTTLVTALAAAQTVELAEDQARSRALAVLGIYATKVDEEKETSPASRDVTLPLTPPPYVTAMLSDASDRSLTFDATASHFPSEVASLDAPARADGDALDALSDTPRPTQPPLVPEAEVSDTSSLAFSEFNHQESTDPPAAVTPLEPDEIPFGDEVDSAEVEIEEDVETPLPKSEKKRSSSKRKDVPVVSYSQNELEKDTNRKPATDTLIDIDVSDIIARTTVELKRLGWTNQRGRDYLVQTYGKRSRQLLTDAELLDFLHYLESEPTPE